MKEEQYHELCKTLAANEGTKYWFDYMMRRHPEEATCDIPDDDFKLLVKELPKMIEGARRFGKLPSEIMGGMVIYHVISAEGDDEHHDFAFFREMMQRIVGWSCGRHETLREKDTRSALPFEVESYLRVKKLLSRFQTLLAGFGKKHEFASINTFRGELSEEQVAAAVEFFSHDSLLDVLPPPDTSEEDALRAELESYGKPAAEYWKIHEATFDDLERVRGEATNKFGSVEEAQAFFGPALEKFHAFAQGDMAEIKALLKKARDTYGSVAELRYRYDELGAGYQEQTTALTFLERKETEFDEFCAEIAGKFAHQIDINLMVAEYSNQDDVERRVRIYSENEKLANIGLSFVPEHAKLLEYAKTMAEKIAADQEAHAKAVESAVWPGHIDGFIGPGDANELALAALKDIQRLRKKETEKLGEHYFAAAMAANWWVSRKNVLQQPTEIRTSVWVARTLPRQPGVATVIQTDVIAKYLKEEPPFSTLSSRTWTAFRMPIDKILDTATVIDAKALEAGRKVSG